MLELQSDSFHRILPLLGNIQQAVLPYAVCQGINLGRVFADDPRHPGVALLWTNVGYFFLAGDPAGQTRFADISECLIKVLAPAAQAGGETGFIFITAPGWEEHLEELLPGRSRIQIFRRTFTLDEGDFREAVRQLPELPPGFSLVRMDQTLAEKAGLQPSWRNADEFVQHGLGYAVLDGDRLVSACTSIFACSRGLEMDIHTVEELRGRGLAQICTAAFISECLRQGREPNYECFWDNQPSINLAGRLGFQMKADYPVTFWEEG